jgi:hypothetical protein
MPVTLLNIFEVPPEADTEFISWWKRTGAFIEQRIGPVSAELHRSVDGDARFRFVNVATIESPQQWQRAVSAPGFPGDEQPGIRHPGLYELVRGEEPVQRCELVMIAPSELGAEHDDAFIRNWDDSPGGRLYRSLSPRTAFRFVELSTHRNYTAPAARTSFPSYPALYEVVAR